MPFSNSDFEQLMTSGDVSSECDLNHRGVDADDLERLMVYLSKHPKITSLNLAGSLLGNNGIHALLKATTITHLNLMGNNLSDRALEVLSQLKQLVVLNLNINNLGNKGALALGDLPQLQQLLLNGNTISNKGLSTLSEHPHLRYLSLMNNDINSEGVKVLMYSKTLQTLCLDNNYLGDEGASIIAKHSGLQELSLSDNALTAVSAMVLAEHFKGNYLNISSNHIGDKGASSLFKNAHVKTLNLSNNQISHDVLAAFSVNTTLMALNLSYNHVTNSVLAVLAKSLSLTDLNLTANNINHLGLEYFSNNKKLTSCVLNYNRLDDLSAVALSKNTSIKTLSLIGNAISAKGAIILSTMQQLSCLFLSYNEVGDEGAAAFAQSIILQELALSYNRISDIGALAFVKNTHLRRLDLNFNQISEQGYATLTASLPAHVIVFCKEQPADFSQESLSHIFLLSTSLFCIISKQCLIQFFNAYFCNVLGFEARDLLGQPLDIFLHPEDRALLTILIDQPVATDIVVRFLSKDGDFRSINWCFSVQGERIYMIGTNLGAQKKAEKVLNQLALQTQAKAEASAEASKGKQKDFIAHLCHEIRNPVSGVVSLSEVISEHVKNIHSDSQVLMQHVKPSAEVTAAFEHLTQDSNAIVKAVSDIQLCCRHQTGILDENLDLEKIASDQLVFSNLPFNMAFIIKEMALMVKAKAEQKGLAFKVISSYSPENWVKGDAERIKQIILNLLNNAITFTDKGSIFLSLTLLDQDENQNRFVISVKDTGLGLKEEDVKAIFESYRHANLATGSQYHGSGLGLTIAKQLAQHMGGDLSVKSQWQVGSEFICTLACNRLNAEEQALVCQSAAPSSPPARSAGSRHVLVVEDNEINRKCLCFMLAKAGHSCVVAHDGEEAVNVYQQQHALLDVIFMDTIMPKKNGLEATREIRQLEQTEQLPHKMIISLSGNAQEEDKAAAFRAGVDAYLTKPFNKEQIGNLINQLCATKASVASHALSPSPGVTRRT